MILSLTFADVPNVSINTSNRYTANPQFLGTLGDWHFHKVSVRGKMSSDNVKSACNGAGLVTPCPGQSGCEKNDAHCTITGQTSCDEPRKPLSKKICNVENPSQCQPLNGVYAYMAKGINGHLGNNIEDGFAFCASKIGRFS